MSSLSWLDYSEYERRKVLDIVDLFREKETRDELGIGGVRDGFADLLFPGTSTIMTRARYFLIVPWLYQRLEARQISSAEMANKARAAELDLVEVISRSSDHDGLIGKRAKRRLKRLPSSVYWQGLRVWEICMFYGDQAQYHRSLDRFYRVLDHDLARALERDTEHDDVVRPNWHGGLIPPPHGFPKKCSLRLSRGEAEYLSERIRLSPSCANSLLAELVARGWRTEPMTFPWEHPHRADLQPDLQEQLLHAHNFSEAMHGSVLIYNLVLAEQTKRRDARREFIRLIEKWDRTLTRRWSAFREWNRDRFWQLALAGNPRISAGTREFVNTWLDLLLRQSSPAALTKLPAIQELIRNRERRLKKSLARIDNPRASELWNGASGIGQIDFRWAVTQRILRDILPAMVN